MRKPNYIGSIIILQIIIILPIAACWITNLYKLTQCDFASPYKGEVIHAVGLIPPASLLTVWFDDK